MPRPRVLDMPSEGLLDEGYDSDCNQGPFVASGVDAEEEEVEEDEQVAAEAPAEDGEDVGPDSPQEENTEEEEQLTEDAVGKMKVSELREHLKKRGLAINGLKAVLVERLKEAVKNNVPLLKEGEGGRATDEGNLAKDECFPPGSHWELMEATGEEIEEDMNVGGIQFVGPTEQLEEINLGQKKRNFTETFDRAPFISRQCLLPDKTANGRIKKKKLNSGKEVYSYSLQQPPSDETVPNFHFLFEQNIGFDSHPADWLEPLFPSRRYKDTHPDAVTLQDMTKWTNAKAMLACAGDKGASYSNFQYFSIDEIRSHLGLYLLQGVSPSPQVEQKFKNSEEDPVNGSELCHRVFGESGPRRHKEFKAFFAAQDPTIDVPDSKKFPNWKIDPILRHVMRVSKDAIMIGKHISVDEQDIGFQGNHRDKQRISYKRVGDGFLVDALCADGYTYCWFFRNQPAPKKWVEKGLSPLHSRVLSLYSQLPKNTKNYHCKMDNLFMSAKFAKFAKCSSKVPVLIHGVCRSHNRGLPKCIEQKLLTKKSELAAARGTLKVAKLVGDPTCELVAASLYDQKPVYLLSSSCDSVKWIKKDRKLYHKKEGKKVNVPFYRLNLIDDYNMHMNNVDIADQLRLQYSSSHWIRNRKWWWSIFLWSLETALTNAYVLYRKFYSLHNRKQMTHYDFVKNVALAWIDKKTFWKRESEGEGDDDGSAFCPSSSSSSSSRSKQFQAALTRAAKKKLERKQNTRVSAASLDPKSCALKIRLNKKMPHLPVGVANESQCQLCWFTEKKRNRSQTMKCSTCNVSLCIGCYEPFHIWDSPSSGKLF